MAVPDPAEPDPDRIVVSPGAAAFSLMSVILALLAGYFAATAIHVDLDRTALTITAGLGAIFAGLALILAVVLSVAMGHLEQRK